MSYTQSQVDTLATELSTDPLTRGYAGMTDAQKVTSLNAVDRDGPHDPTALLQYLTLERFRTGTLYGRLQLVAGARPVRAGAGWGIAPLPIGAADADITVTQDQIAAAQALLRYVDTDTTAAVTLLDSRITSILDDLGPSGAGGCEAIGGGDKTAIQALSQNQQSRAQELGLPPLTLSVLSRVP